MNQESKIPATSEPSLNPLRIAAVCGMVAALILIMIGFVTSALLGVIALIVAPAIPLLFVLVTDRARRH